MQVHRTAFSFRDVATVLCLSFLLPLSLSFSPFFLISSPVVSVTDPRPFDVPILRSFPPLFHNVDMFRSTRPTRRSESSIVESPSVTTSHLRFSWKWEISCFAFTRIGITSALDVPLLFSYSSVWMDREFHLSAPAELSSS